MKRLTTALALAVCLLGPVAHADTPQSPADEDLLKAVFVFNFAKFTRWPPLTWDGPGADLLLCTAGEDAVADALQGLAGRRISDHVLVVRRLGPEQEANECHILYVASSEGDRYDSIVASVADNPVLTVSQLARAGNGDAIIRLIEEGGRIRFIIDVEAARDCGLEFSSRLLDLGIIKGREDL